jgi:enolase
MSDSKIKHIHARQIFDSRGRPTVEVEIGLQDGSLGRASVPSGASTGTFEAHELRDGDENHFDGLGVSIAVNNVNEEIAAEITGKDAADQFALDNFLRELDNTENLRRLGANAVLGVSLAACRAAAISRGLPLYAWIARLSGTMELVMPRPMVNILSGGLHAREGMDVQDFLYIPVGANSLVESIENISSVRNAANKLAFEKGLPTLLADEGGLSPGFETGEEALLFMHECFERAGLGPGEKASIAIDIAASGLRNDAGDYAFVREGVRRSAIEVIDLVGKWADEFCVSSVEDALSEEDWENWKTLNERLGKKLQIVGDDLFTTNLKRVEKGVAENSANAVLIKLNQNGTLSGTLDVVKKAKENNFATIVSARSGETEDSFIADLAVGTAAGQIKIGSFRNSERLSKYNRLLQIAEHDIRFSLSTDPSQNTNGI